MVSKYYHAMSFSGNFIFAFIAKTFSGNCLKHFELILFFLVNFNATQ